LPRKEKKRKDKKAKSK